jgi:hypothetical protein
LKAGRSVVFRASTDTIPLGSVMVSAPGKAAPLASVIGTHTYEPTAFGVAPLPTRSTNVWPAAK